ncbi:MFS transporter [Lysinibacillus sp. fkY74-1]|uniref:MFS transporter n=3 Tax=Lysinibacillus TaxID=400634 RepID=W7S420_LYSSH|nr:MULTISPECIES: MFS transporter [Lysinibacillus]MBE5084222.1 MFS transporter [Bacillus thuringiensis]ACA41050.1 Probable glucarate transporter (D-glucarate permease) [Lysinibacillus sphaericus C3-41]AMO33015.1 MFS transporter [Lysinibacillus sphaericus]AMR91880.1 MFS transporter [Lysinibacillus sphaericus]ANA45928.1 MFS transporter [Lysinibacillus sphaericus]
MTTNDVTKKSRNVILALLFLGWSLGNLDRYIMNYAVVSITGDLQLDASSTGIILSAFFLGYAIMQIPGGWLADKFGAKRILLMAVIMWSIFTGLTAIAWSLTAMIVIRFLFGIGEGGFQPSSSKIIATIFPKEERGRAMSIMLTSGGIVSLIVPLLAAYLLGTIGWRMMFIIIGAIGAIIAYLYWKYIQLPKAETADAAETGSPTVKVSFKELLKTPLMWNLIIAYFCIYAVNWGLVSWIPTYLQKNRGLDLMSIGWAQTIPAITTIIGVYGSGYIIDKLPKGMEKVLGSISCAVIGILLYLMFTAKTVTLFIGYQTVVSIFIAFVITLLPVIVLKKLPSSITGSAMGIANTGGQLAGFVTPMAIGFMVDAFNGSFDAAFWMLIGFALICIVSLVTLNDQKGALLKA